MGLVPVTVPTELGGTLHKELRHLTSVYVGCNCVASVEG